MVVVDPVGVFGVSAEGADEGLSERVEADEKEEEGGTVAGS